MSLLSPERVIFLGGLNLKFNPRSVNLLWTPLDLKVFTNSHVADELASLSQFIDALLNWKPCRGKLEDS